MDLATSWQGNQMDAVLACLIANVMGNNKIDNEGYRADFDNQLANDWLWNTLGTFDIPSIPTNVSASEKPVFRTSITAVIRACAGHLALCDLAAEVQRPDAETARRINNVRQWESFMRLIVRDPATSTSGAIAALCARQDLTDVTDVLFRRAAHHVAIHAIHWIQHHDQKRSPPHSEDDSDVDDPSHSFVDRGFAPNIDVLVAAYPAESRWDTDRPMLFAAYKFLLERYPDIMFRAISRIPDHGRRTVLMRMCNSVDPHMFAGFMAGAAPGRSRTPWMSELTEDVMRKIYDTRSLR